jgi:hypothetical protein
MGPNFSVLVLSVLVRDSLCPGLLLGILASHDKIRKCTDTIVAFTSEYSKGIDVCVLTSCSLSKDTPGQEVRIERIPKDSTIHEIKGRSLDRTWPRVPIALT